MGPEILISIKYVMFIQAVLMIHTVSQDYSSDLWAVLIRKWRHHKRKRLSNRIQRFADKRKRYWEIDMKDPH